jgi:hypothetical protein
MHRSLIVIENAGKNFPAYSPYLSRRGMAGKTPEEMEGHFV